MKKMILFVAGIFVGSAVGVIAMCIFTGEQKISEGERKWQVLI